MKVMAFFYAVIGVGFLAVGIDDDLTGGAITLDAGWASTAFAVVGALWTFIGVRGILGKSKPLARRTDAELRSVLLRTSAAGALDLLVAAGLVTLAVSKDIASGITVGRWAPAVFWTIGPLLGLRGVIFLIPRTPAQVRKHEAELEAERRRDAMLAEISGGGGLPGRATIKQVKGLGSGNISPYVELELDVSVGGGPSLAATWRGSVRNFHLGQLVPGQSVPIRAHAADHTVLEIDWGKP